MMIERVTGDIQLTALAVIRVVQPGSEGVPQTNQPLPTTTDWAELPDGSCTDLDSDSLLPIIPVSVPQEAKGSGVFSAAFGFRSIATGQQLPPAPPPNTTTASTSTQSTPTPGMRRRQVKMTPYDPLPPFGTAVSRPPMVQNGGPPPPAPGS